MKCRTVECCYELIESLVHVTYFKKRRKLIKFTKALTLVTCVQDMVGSNLALGNDHTDQLL
jgi:hypothetical protein